MRNNVFYSTRSVPDWTVSTKSHSIWACSSVVGGDGNFRIPAGKLSLSDLLLRLPGRICPVVGLIDADSCPESLGVSWFGEYLLISDALDLQKMIYYLRNRKHVLCFYQSLYKSTSVL